MMPLLKLLLMVQLVSWSYQQSAPFCDSDCEFMDQIMMNQRQCIASGNSACACDNGTCIACIEPKAPCHCFCVEPGDPPVTDPDTPQDPPKIQMEEIKEAFRGMVDSLRNSSAIVSEGVNALQGCFGTGADIAKKANNLNNSLNNAVKQANKVANMRTGEVDDAKMTTAVDSAISKLDRARKKMEDWAFAAAKAVAKEADSNIRKKSQMNDRTRMGNLLDKFNATRGRTSQCRSAVVVITQWHPYLWRPWWPYTYWWSIYHRIYYYWLCAWYIRIVIRLRIWWWWVWRPWQFYLYWPWYWCRNWWFWGWWRYYMLRWCRWWLPWLPIPFAQVVQAVA